VVIKERRNMRKISALSLTLLLLFGALTAPAAAVPPDDLTQLAVWFPEETPLFIAVRTDDGFIETLDGVVGVLNRTLPPGTLPFSSLNAALDMASAPFAPQGTFQSVFRSWLGDTAAIGILSAPDLNSSDSPPVLAAIAITDRDGAIAYLDRVGSLRRYAREERDGAIIYSPMLRMAGQPFYIFRENVLLIGIEADNVTTAGVQASALAASQKFRDAIALLPQPSYNAIIYNDVAALLSATPDFAEMMESNLGGIGSLFSAIAPQVYGATIVNGRSLTLDITISYADISVLEQLGGVALPGEIPPTDPAFARYIPAGTPLLILANNAAGTQPIAQLDRVIDQLEQSGAFSEREIREVRQAVFALRTGIRAVSGLEAEEAFAWMSGDIALTLGLSSTALNAANPDGLLAALPVEFAFIAEAVDPAGAAALVAGLTNALRDLPSEQITIIEQTFDGTPALGFAIKTPDLPFTVELFLASDDEVFVFGTRDAVAFALDPVAGAGLDTDPAYVEALRGILPDAVAIAYASGTPFLPLADMLARQEDFSLSRDGQNLGAALRLINSSSISSTVLTTDTYSAMARLVLTLPE
jgi:hypothetical protein